MEEKIIDGASDAVETMAPQSLRPEAEEVSKFLEEIGESGKEKFLEFIRGARFALELNRKAM